MIRDAGSGPLPQATINRGMPASDRLAVPPMPHYRPDIDGLRALAVALVVAFHAFPNLVRGGFVGVDVFFVISGFLISGIICDELRAGRFSVARFYARRIRRIFPALIVILVAVTLGGWFVFLPNEYQSLGEDIAGGAAFVPNFTLLGQVGYFDTLATRNPLLHLWSLGIEEQFYAVWPLLLALSHRRISLSRVVLIGAIGSFILNVALVGRFPSQVFFLPVTRAWELLIGAALVGVDRETLRATVALAPAPVAAVIGGVIERIERAATPRSVIGLILIGGAAALLRPTSVFPGWAALAPTLGTLLVISAPSALPNRAILSSRRLVAIGLISYPLYLWHWPILTFAGIVSVGGLSAVHRAALVLLSVLLAWATFKFVERPIRFTGSAAAWLPRLIGALGIVLVLGIAIVQQEGMAFRVPQEVREAAVAAMVDIPTQWRLHTCLLERDDESKQFAPDCVEERPHPKLALWGDSLASSLYPGLRALQGHRAFALSQLTVAGCPPILGYREDVRPHCKDNNDYFMSVIVRLRPDIVLLHSTWSYDGLQIDSLGNVVAELKRAGVGRVVILGPLPQWLPGLPQALLDYYRDHPLAPALPARSRYHLQEPIRELDTYLARKAGEWGAEYISAWDIFCNDAGCLSRVGNAPADLTTFDYVHLTLAASRYLAVHIEARLFGESD